MDDHNSRVLPHDIQAEMYTLGAAMISADAAVTVVEELTTEDFLRPAHRAVFTAIESLIGRAEPADALTVRLELQAMKDGGHVPDGSYLFTLIEHVPTASNVSYYIKALLGISALRRLAQVGPTITALAYDSAPDDAGYAVDTAQKVFEEATQITKPSRSKSLADLMVPFMDALERGEDMRGVTTGLVDLDAVLGGRIRPGQLITIGARPGVGKSVLMAGIAHHVGVKLGLPVFISTLEMSTDEYLARIVSLDGSINIGHLLEPKKLTDDDWSRLQGTSGRIMGTPCVEVNDDPGLGVAGIRSTLRDMRRAGNPAAVVIVDYLQLMESPGKAENRQVEVSRISRGLKLLAKEFEVPVVVGSQLNRQVESRAEKIPGLHDLRESGATENDSDIVILLNRPDNGEPESPRAGEIDLIVAKNRSGPRTTVTAAFQGHYSRVTDMAREPWTPTRCVS